jgi:alpha-L-rhamnosidase
MCYNLDVYDTFREWLYNIRLSQNEAGVLPGIIPTTGWGYQWGNGPMSDAVIVEMPYQLYRFSGKKEILEENLPAIKKYIRYAMTRENADGLFLYGIGDWCEAGSQNEFSMSTPGEVCDSLTVLQILLTAKKICDILGEKDFAEETWNLYQKIRTNFRKKYCLEKGWIGGKTQTGQAMGLVFGVFDKEEEKLAYDSLISLIHANNNVMKVGVVGVKFLFNVLARNGDIDLALELVTTEKWPSYGYLMRLGATTLWEMFQHVDKIEDFKPYDCDGRALSLNHHFWGCISAWFYREIVGLNLINYDFIEISPKIPSELQFAEGTLETTAGKIKVRWEKNNDKLLLNIENQGFNGMIKINGYTLEGDNSLKDGITEYVLLKN